MNPSVAPLTPDEIGKVLVALSLAYQLIVFLVPCGYRLIMDARRSPSLGHWGSQHSWYFVFLMGNSLVFWLSMHSSRRIELFETLGDWVVCGKIAWMTIAGSWIFNYSFTNPTIPVASHRARWGAALTVPILMNLVALYHTATVFKTQGLWKGTVWVLLDVLAALFYGLILIRLGDPKRLDPPQLAFLWRRVVFPLAILLLFDLVILRTRVASQ